MGLIKAAAAAAGGVLADSWMEFFYCDAMEADVLVMKGEKRVGKHSSNKKGSDNVITNGSGIAVADGQCMIIVDNGKISEICAEPGQYTYNSGTEPSIFSGKLGEGIKATFNSIGRRFQYGGDAGTDARVYYFNTKELVDNKFGTPNPVPFRVVDKNIGLDVDVSLRCNGVYSYKISNPLLFYTNVCGNVSEAYTRDEIDQQLRTEFVSALQPAFGKLSDKEIRPNQIPTHTTELEEAMNEALSKKWEEKRGLRIVSIAIGSVTLPPEDQQMIKELQRKAVMRDPSMAGATMVDAQAEALKAAASNANGAMAGFMGFNMAQGAMGGMNAQNFYAMGQQNAAAQQAPQASAQSAGAATWTCPKCGTKNTGKFCTNCGEKQPVASGEWTCAKCGAKNTGKFCTECGTAKPADGEWTCPQCGTVNTGKCCTECGTKRP